MEEVEEEEEEVVVEVEEEVAVKAVEEQEVVEAEEVEAVEEEEKAVVTCDADRASALDVIVEAQHLRSRGSQSADGSPLGANGREGKVGAEGRRGRAGGGGGVAGSGRLGSILVEEGCRHVRGEVFELEKCLGVQRDEARRGGE